MKLGEVQGILAIGVLAAWLSGGCDRKADPVERVDVPAEPDASQVKELKRRKAEVMERIENMKVEEDNLRRDIREVEAKSRTVEAQLAEVQAFKEQIAKNLEELEKRWAGEFRGIDLEHVSLPEAAELMNRRINELAEENVALKRKLAERTK